MFIFIRSKALLLFVFDHIVDFETASRCDFQEELYRYNTR